MKKHGFSYLELIICMALVVMVVILSTPYLTHIDTPASATYGMHVCYAYYDTEKGDWVLKYNEKRNSEEYLKSNGMDVSAENVPPRCVFTLPKGVSAYSVSLFGGSGAGGGATEAGENFKLCNDGESSSEEAVNYSSSPSQTSLSFGFFNNDGTCSFDGCVGKGGEPDGNQNGQETRFKNTESKGGQGGSCNRIVKCDSENYECVSKNVNGENKDFDFEGLESKGGTAGKVNINSDPAETGNGGRGSGGAIIIEWGN